MKKMVALFAFLCVAVSSSHAEKGLRSEVVWREQKAPQRGVVRGSSRDASFSQSDWHDNGLLWKHASVGFYGGIGAFVSPESTTALPDIRICVERSFQIDRRLSIVVDASMFSCGVRLGYLISPLQRVAVGMKLPGLFGDATIRVTKNNVTTKYDLVRSLPLSPYVSYDKYVSEHCFVRGMLSYDYFSCITTERDMSTKADGHWPQFSLGVHYTF